MKNVIKPHYFTVQPIVNEEAVINIENKSIETTLPITRICEHNGYEVMDHIFYINSEKELREYELLYEFVQITLEMAKDYYCEEISELDNIFVKFNDAKTDIPVFALHIWEEDGEIDFVTVDFSNSHEEECDGDCEHCTKFDDEEDYEDDIPVYYFGFEW